MLYCNVSLKFTVKPRLTCDIQKLKYGSLLERDHLTPLHEVFLKHL